MKFIIEEIDLSIFHVEEYGSIKRDFIIATKINEIIRAISSNVKTSRQRRDRDVDK